MNTAVRTLQTSTLSQVSSYIISSKQYFAVISLIFAVLLSAFCVIYVKDVNRRLAGDLQMAQASRDQIYLQKSQLLLEQTTWSSPARVEQIAQEKFDMVIPKPRSIVMVNDL